MARAYNQAQKFGVEMVIPDQAHQLGEREAESSKRYFLTVGDDETLQARAVVVASGARYRRLAAAVGEGAQVVSAIHAYLARSGSAAASTIAITRR